MISQEETIPKLNPQLLQAKMDSIARDIEGDTRATLIQRLAEQEMHIGELYTRLSKLYSLQDMRRIIIDNSLLGSPSFLQKKLEIKPSDNLTEYQGFYALESKEAKYHRWSKYNFYFDLPIDRSEERLVLLQFQARDGFEKEISCYIDGCEINLELEKSEISFVLIGSISPADVFTETRISFMVGKSFVPTESDAKSNDDRSLSIMFEKLNIK